MNYDRHFRGNTYNSDNLHLEIGIARNIKRKDGISNLRPFVKYEYIRINPDSYSEYGSRPAALHFDVDKQDIHIVRAGFELQTFLKNEKDYYTVGIFYLGKYGDTTTSAIAYPVLNSANSFRTYSLPEDKDNIGFSLGTMLTLNKFTDFRLNFTSLIGSNGLSNNVDVTFNYRF